MIYFKNQLKPSVRVNVYAYVDFISCYITIPSNVDGIVKEKVTITKNKYNKLFKIKLATNIISNIYSLKLLRIIY